MMIALLYFQFPDKIGTSKIGVEYSDVSGRRIAFVLWFTSARQRESVTEAIESAVTMKETLLKTAPQSRTLAMRGPYASSQLPPPVTSPAAVKAPTPAVEATGLDAVAIDLDAHAGTEDVHASKLRPHAAAQQRQSVRRAVLTAASVPPLSTCPCCPLFALHTQ